MATFRIETEARPKQLYVYPDLCVGCHLCSYACSVNKSGTLSKQKTAIRIVKKDGGYEFPNYCIQCEDKTCMKYCPTDALVWNAKVGVVQLIEERCIACGICALKCAYDAISFVDAEVVKCDLCMGDPQCVKFCPTDAIRYEAGGDEKEKWREEQGIDYIPVVHPVLGMTGQDVKREREAAKAKGVVFPTPKEVAQRPNPAGDAAAGRPFALPTGTLERDAGREAHHEAKELLPTLKGVDEVPPVPGLSDIESRVYRAMETGGAGGTGSAVSTDDLIGAGLKLTHTIVAFSLLEMERKGFVKDAGSKRYRIAR